MAVSEQRYLISENDLNLYRTYGENLYFQPPSIFDPSTEEGQNVKQLDVYKRQIQPYASNQ